MRCPSCRKPASEHDAACGQCGFSLEALSRHAGIPPLLNGPLADPAGLLSKGARSAALKTLRAVEQRFPQVTLVAVVTEVPVEWPPAVYAFWLFNRGSLFSAVEKGGDNHGVLLLIDSAQARACTMIGYGLEPFVPESMLEVCLTAASRSIDKGQHGAAIESFARELERQFATLLGALPRTFGCSEEGAWNDAQDTAQPVAARADEDLF